MRNIIRSVVCVLLFMGTVPYPFIHSKVYSQEITETILVGSIGDNPKKEAEEFGEFTEYLAERLKDYGIKKGRLVVVPTMAEMAELLKQKKVDIYIDSPFPITIVSKLSGGKPFLHRWKKGVAEYHSVIFVRKDSDINTLEDLKGKTVAFEQAFSTGSYFLPKTYILRQGYQLNYKEEIATWVSHDEIGYIFSNDDANTIFWVRKGIVAAGAIHNYHFQELPREVKRELKIIAKTINVPRHVVLHRKGMKPALVRKIEKILIDMDRDKIGKEVLRGMGKTVKFDHFPGGVKKALVEIEKLIPFIEKELLRKE